MRDIRDITGRQKVCGVIGQPIGHSLSPLIHNQLASAANESMTYVPFEVTRENLGEAIVGAHALGIGGLNVTMPHKQEVMDFVSGLDEWATQIGAVNTLVYEEKGYKGYNTDWYGVQKALESMGCDYEGENVAIIGSGGAAYAAAVCVMGKASELHLFNRTLAKAEALAQHLRSYTQIPIVVHAMEEVTEEPMYLVIQTTGIGMGHLVDQIPECAKGLLAGAEFAMDMIYSPWQTLFLKTALELGVHAINGFDMLYYQGVRAYELMNQCCFNEGLVGQIKQEIEAFVEYEWSKKDSH